MSVSIGFKLLGSLERVLFLLAVLAIATRTQVCAISDAGADGDYSGDSFPYVYATKNNLNSSFPVVEHIAPTGKKGLDNNKPAFLYSKNQGFRVVIFYGHWCATCINFRPHFVHFAQRVQQLAAQQNEKVDIFAVSCHPNRKLCRKQTAAGYPLIRLLKPGYTEGMDMKHTEINPVKVLHKLGIHLDVKEEDEDWDVADTIVEPEPVSQFQQLAELVLGKSSARYPYHRRTREELKHDIHLSFDFAMRDVFSSEEPLAPKASAALKTWLKLLYKTIPVAWELHTLINELIKDFTYIYKHEAYLYGILDKRAPESNTWSPACSHGNLDAGYTCGLWELFHAMTVGVVEHNNMVQEHRRIATEDAARTLRDYVENFFGCEDCRNNFLASYDSCEFDRCNRLKTDATGVAKNEQTSWAQLPLWLFEVHNSVNVRLLKERARRENRREPSRQEEIDVLWPPKQECLPCWKGRGKAGETSWDKSSLYKFMQLEYGQRDVNAGKVREELQALTVIAEKKEKQRTKRIRLTNGSALLAFCAVSLLGAKIKRRRVTGLHKKQEDSDEKRSLVGKDPSQRRPKFSPKV